MGKEPTHTRNMNRQTDRLFLENMLSVSSRRSHNRSKVVGADIKLFEFVGTLSLTCFEMIFVGTQQPF